MFGIGGNLVQLRPEHLPLEARLQGLSVRAFAVHRHIKTGLRVAAVGSRMHRTGLHLGQARLAQLGHQRLCLHHIRRLNATDGKQRTLHLTTRHLHGQADARQGNLTGGRIRFAGQQGAEVAQLHSTPIQRG